MINITNHQTLGTSPYWFPSSALYFLLATAAVAMAGALTITTPARTTKPQPTANRLTEPPSSWGWDCAFHPNESSWAKCLPSKNNIKTTAAVPREPSYMQKQLRRWTVFQLAFRIFAEYKLAQRKAKKIQRRLGLNDDDDDHPEIIALWDQVHDRNAQRLLCTIMKLEGFWVKVGQYLSARADVMPPAYLQALSQLQDSMPPRSLADTWATLREELSEDDLKRIVRVDPVPLSTASLAQVHRATIISNSNNANDRGDEMTTQEAVLKIQHRGVATLMIQDMENLRVILKTLAYMDPDFDFEPVVREYSQEVRKELDFRTEHKNMDEIRLLLDKYDHIPAIIPKTLPGLVKERVLVMEFCEGFPIRDTNLLDEYQVDRELLLERICSAWAVQMHVAGVFNADPHAGNILVSTAPGNVDSSVPVLLDFGLTKRLDPHMKVAFARLMHSSHETDVDGLLLSFEEMGLKMNRHDPFQDMANMQRGFGDTTPQSSAREVSKQKSKDYQRRMDAQRAEAGVEKGKKLRSPVDAWPSELILFGRVTAMLRGMCSRLDVNYPYLRTMAMAARETLLQDVPTEEHATTLVHPSTENATQTSLQKRLKEEIRQLFEDGHIVGLQICVLKHGVPVANLAAGTIGTANPRPVTPNTLFNVFSVSKGVLTIGLLRLVQDGFIEDVDDPVSKYWPEFGAGDEEKANTTIRQVLGHQAGLANAYPEDATVDTLLDWATMTNFIAIEAKPAHAPGSATEYHALSYAWLVGGIIEAVTAKPYEEWLDRILPLRNAFTQREEDSRTLYLAGISPDVCNLRDLAVLSMDRRAMQQEAPAKPIQKVAETLLNKVTTEQTNGDTSENVTKEEAREARMREARKVLAKYKGLQQLMNPSVFNMRKVREAKLPSANGHASAATLAAVFDSVIRGTEGCEPLLSKHILDQARCPSQASVAAVTTQKAPMLNDAHATFGLGFQLHEFTLGNGEKVMSFGHSGLGGSVVLAIPEEKVTIALTVNQLSMDSVARKRLLGVVFEELGLEAPSTLEVATTRSTSSPNSLATIAR